MKTVEMNLALYVRADLNTIITLHVTGGGVRLKFRPALPIDLA